MPVPTPAVQYGRNFVLQVLSGAYTTVMGAQTTGMTLGNVMVDTTSTQSGGWRQILSDCGNQTVTINSNGVFKGDFALALIQQYWENRSLQTYRIYFSDDGSHWDGMFLVSKLEYTGTYNGARMYNVTLESSGPINFTGYVP